MADERPIIIKKVKKHAGGHHGGAWKLAYADFVTAMMAFFLLMWLLGSVTEGDLKGIAEYFQNPWKPSFSGGAGSGEATRVIPGGGEDMVRTAGQVRKTNKGTQDRTVTSADEDEGHLDSRRTGPDQTESTQDKAYGQHEIKDAQDLLEKMTETAQSKQEQLEKQLQIMDAVQLQQMKERLEELVADNEVLGQFKQQLQIDISIEGLRVQLLDEAKRPMFDLASARMLPYAADIIQEVARVIDQLPNHVSITGHTDARPYGGAGRGYSNWELSTDRANAARRALVAGGLDKDKILRVVGLGSSVPLDPKDPFAPMNRRISIIVMNRATEGAVMNASGPSPGILDKGQPDTLPKPLGIPGIGGPPPLGVNLPPLPNPGQKIGR